MNFKKYFVAALPALLLASCASDEPATGGEDVNNGKNVYARIQIQVPTATRSNTLDKPDGDTNSSAGWEEGKPYENDINNVTIVLATKNDAGQYEAQAYGSYASNEAMPDPSVENTYTILFQDQDIVELSKQNKPVYVFAYCNTSMGKDAFTAGDNLDNQISTITGIQAGTGIWEKGNFMMTNAPGKPITEVTLPSEKELLNSYNSAEKAFNLGTVEVARTAARFDYKVVNDNKYQILDANVNSDGEHAVVAEIEMVDMIPFNIADKFYTLPRVSADGTSAGWTICGEEVGSMLGSVTPNYVVSPSSTSKTYFLPLPTAAANSSYSGLEGYTPINTWYKAATDDNDDNWTAADKTGYKIWRYVTENTIPGIDNQLKGITTGVIFKGKLTNPANPLMKAAMDNGKPIYFYNGICYGDIANLRRVVANLNEDHKMRAQFLKVFGTDGEEYLKFKYDENGKPVLDENKKYTYVVADADLKDCTSDQNYDATTGKGIFKILRPDETGVYYTYYVYYNRHNDNGNNSVMGPMEFATVRNNVYKLSVTMVSDFGHTDDPKDDSEPEDPHHPDESPKTYFRVSCHVLPWIVRVNNIEF